MPQPPLFPCGGVGQPPCPPVNAVEKPKPKGKPKGGYWRDEKGEKITISEGRRRQKEAAEKALKDAAEKPVDDARLKKYIDSGGRL